jgi:ferredoxin
LITWILIAIHVVGSWCRSLVRSFFVVVLLATHRIARRCRGSARYSTTGAVSTATYTRDNLDEMFIRGGHVPAHGREHIVPAGRLTGEADLTSRSIAAPNEGHPMRVLVDQVKCTGHGICEELAPDVFEIDDDGIARVLIAEVHGTRLTEVQAACVRCPTQAITLEDDDSVSSAENASGTR